MSDADKRARLIEIVRQRSYGTGVEIKLASGRTSDFYFNLKPTMLHAEGAYLIGELVLDAIASLGATHIGGLEVGAIPIATTVVAASHRRNTPIDAFFVRKEVKAHGTQKLVEGLVPGDSLAGHTVVVVEDVTTTGGSSLKAAEIVRAQHATLASVVTVVDREEGAADSFEAAGIPFTAILKRSDFL
ncbi:MAG: orotate phosphoribosyltransferase [Pseudomonadota bacterium]